jgi:hypothetical protein
MFALTVLLSSMFIYN